MTFPLAGLLRVRGVQERAAAEDLSRASDQRVQAEAARERTAASLAEIGSTIGDAQTLLAMAAARAAGRSALSDLQSLIELRRDEEAQAKSTNVEARRELKGLERLESAHRTHEVKTELDAEQNALDEIAVARAARREGSAA